MNLSTERKIELEKMLLTTPMEKITIFGPKSLPFEDASYILKAYSFPMSIFNLYIQEYDKRIQLLKYQNNFTAYSDKFESNRLINALHQKFPSATKKQILDRIFEIRVINRYLVANPELLEDGLMDKSR